MSVIGFKGSGFYGWLLASGCWPANREKIIDISGLFADLKLQSLISVLCFQFSYL
jgi:hypothetical protein